MELIKLDDYGIYIGPLSESLSGVIDLIHNSKLVVIIDCNTKEHCYPVLKELLTDEVLFIEIKAGERHKNIDTCQIIWQQLMDAQVGRDALLLNLGGGVIGDMGGFCASTFKRGIDFLQIPTTLLAQVDASIGGKLGIDFGSLKNSIGLFNNPKAVLVDPAFLGTLPNRELRSGYAEVIKHSLIGDAEQWEYLSTITQLGVADWSEIIPSSLLIKKRIVEADPLEKGLRKALNFGHTIGHAVEGFALHTEEPLLHGEAIAIGMLCETFLSHKILNLPIQDVQRISRYLLQIYGHRQLNTDCYSNYLELMRNDKKNEKGKINFSLIEAPGAARVNQTCSTALIKESLDFYNALGEV